MRIKFKNPYWSNAAKISHLQRVILVHCILYYEFDQSILIDREYDDLSMQLVEMQNESSEEELKKTQYYYCMYDFDGTTGFDLYGRLKEKDRERLINIANAVLRVFLYGGNRYGV